VNHQLKDDFMKGIK